MMKLENLMNLLDTDFSVPMFVRAWDKGEWFPLEKREPSIEDIDVYAVKIEDGGIYIDLMFHGFAAGYERWCDWSGEDVPEEVLC